MKLRWFVGQTFMMSGLFLSTSIAQGQHVLRYVTSDSSEIAVPLDDQGSPQPSGAAEIPLWTSSFEYDGTSYSFTMVGSDPSVTGAGTTNVPVVIVPLRFKL